MGYRSAEFRPRALETVTRPERSPVGDSLSTARNPRGETPNALKVPFETLGVLKVPFETLGVLKVPFGTLGVLKGTIRELLTS